MIYPDDAKAFSDVMNVTWESCHKSQVDRKTKQYWFAKMQSYHITDVENAFDKWLIENDRLPTINDILHLLKPRQDFHRALPVFRDAEIQKDGLEKINQLVTKSVEVKRNYKAWAHKILESPKNYPDISIRFAKEALSIKEETE